MKVLLLGEGDFSFAASLSKLCPNETADCLGLPGTEMTDIEITATSLDSEETLFQKYPQIRNNLHSISKNGKFQIKHNVDALDLTGMKSENFGIVVWNHPHLGFENAVAHKSLLAHFIHSVSVLDSVSLVVIRLLQGQAERWDLKQATDRVSWRMTEGLRMKELNGFQLKRNNHSKSFISEESRKNWVPRSAMEMKSLTFFLGRDDSVLELGKVLKRDISEDPEIIFTCSFCGKNFSSYQGKSTHERQIHELNKYKFGIFECVNCGKGFKVEEGLVQHGNSCSGSAERIRLNLSKDPPESNYECLICGVFSPNETEHFAIFSQETRQFNCQVCGKSFRNERDLIQHRIVH